MLMLYTIQNPFPVSRHLSYKSSTARQVNLLAQRKSALYVASNSKYNKPGIYTCCSRSCSGGVHSPARSPANAGVSQHAFLLSYTSSLASSLAWQQQAFFRTPLCSWLRWLRLLWNGFFKTLGAGATWSFLELIDTDAAGFFQT